MSQSTIESDSVPAPEYDAATLPVESNDLSSRARKARVEPMVVVPDVDSYGYVQKVKNATYTVATASKSQYDVNPRSGGSCPDANINSPEEGCKHTHRVIMRLNDGDLPAPDTDAGWYFRERVPELLTQFWNDRNSLLAGQTHPETDDAAFEDALAEVEFFITTLVDAYDDYRERVTEGDAPALTALVDAADDPVAFEQYVECIRGGEKTDDEL